MHLNANMIFNCIGAIGLQLALAMEGIKAILGLCGITIKGKPALFLFLGLAGFALIESSGYPPRPEMYGIQIVLNVLALTGLYEFVSRLLKAIERR